MNPKLQALACFLVTSTTLAWSTVASAITLTSSGVWTTATTNNGVPTGLHTNTLSWGVAATAAGPSRYQFEGVSNVELDDTDLMDGVIFKLGTFTHHNSPIFAPILTSARLGLTLTIGGATTQTLDVAFLHDETLNRGACPYARSARCPDRVSLPSLGNPEKFTAGGKTYAFRVIGFARNSGDSYETEFITEERQANQTNIFGELTQRSSISGELTSVPEPSTVLASLLLCGLGGIGRRKYRVKHR